jgi:molybdopterin synthase sulfur carrier subunit
MPRVYLPPLLRPLADGHEHVEVEGATVGQLIEELDRRYPGLQARLCETGDLRPGLTVAVDGHVTPRGLLQKVNADSEVHFLPAIGGG